MREPTTFYTLVRVMSDGYQFDQGFSDIGTVDVYLTEEEARTALGIFSRDSEWDGGSVRIARVEVLGK
jgi:hypothetical protein